MQTHIDYLRAQHDKQCQSIFGMYERLAKAEAEAHELRLNALHHERDIMLDDLRRSSGFENNISTENIKSINTSTAGESVTSKDNIFTAKPKIKDL